MASHATRDFQQRALLSGVEGAVGGEQVVFALAARRVERAGEFAKQGANRDAKRACECVELVLARQFLAAQPCRDRGDAGAWDGRGEIGGTQAAGFASNRKVVSIDMLTPSGVAAGWPGCKVLCVRRAARG